MSDFEKMARELVQEIWGGGAATSTYSKIADALRTVRNEALDEAAKVTEEWHYKETDTIFSIANAIRARKE